MKTHIIILLLLLNYNTSALFAQTMKTTDVDGYVKKVDLLKTQNKLEKISYPDMSRCGGGLYGYYHNGDLVLIDATYQAEAGFSSRTIYIKDTSFVQINYREHFAEWRKYQQKYPSDKYEWDQKKMTYTDTLYLISLGHPINFIKKAGNKIISRKINQELIDELVRCGTEMKYELAEVKNAQ